MTGIVMLQTVMQAVRILSLPRSRSLKILQDLVGKLVRGRDSRLFLSEFIHLVIDTFEDIQLAAYDLLVDDAAAPADDGRAFILRLQHDF